MEIRRLPKRTRVLITTTVLYLVFGLVLLIFRLDLSELFHISYKFTFLAGLLAVFASIGGLLLGYLRGDFSPRSQYSKEQDEVRLFSPELPAFFLRDVRDMDLAIKDLQEELRKTKGASSSLKELSAEERELLLSTLKVQLESVLASDLVSRIEQKYASKIADDAQVTQIRKGIEITSLRLRTELAALTRRGNLNLVIGTLTTVAAVLLLAYLVLGATINYTSVPDLLSHFIPRISIAVFIEVFSFFFLKLYKSSLQEIKYFQNELTNVEMRGVALETALLAIHNKTTEPIVEHLMRTDRNLASVAAITDGKEATTLEPKDLANLLDKLAKLLNIGAHK